MDFSPKKIFLFCITLLIVSASAASADESSRRISRDELLDQWGNGMSLYGEELEAAAIEDDELTAAEIEPSNRRSLFWGRVFHYYISYGALSANRVPCPPRSGRSYYTHNCYKARGPVHPYTRGCSAITRCRR